MHMERIRVDRVFDAQPRSGDFSVESGGRKIYGVRLPGRTIPREGVTLALVLRRPGDWSSVLGWRDLAGGKAVLDAPWWNLLWDEIDLFTLSAPLLLLPALVLAGLGGALAALLVVLAVAVWLAARVRRRTVAVRRALADAGPA